MDIDTSKGLVIVMTEPLKGTSGMRVYLDGEQVGVLEAFSLEADKDEMFPRMVFRFPKSDTLAEGLNMSSDLKKRVAAWAKKLTDQLPNCIVEVSPEVEEFI